MNPTHIALVEGIILSVERVNLSRSLSDLPRRLVKFDEEKGEVANDWLALSSAGNGKQRNSADLLEEMSDLMVVAVDLALTPMGMLEGEVLRRELVSEAMRAVNVSLMREDMDPPIPNAVPNLFGHMSTQQGRLSRYVGPNNGWRAFHAARELLGLTMTLALLPLPEIPKTTTDQRLREIADLVDRKVGKWLANVVAGKDSITLPSEAVR